LYFFNINQTLAFEDFQGDTRSPFQAKIPPVKLKVFSIPNSFITSQALALLAPERQ
jgi:hypothetical protein